MKPDMNWVKKFTLVWLFNPRRYNNKNDMFNKRSKLKKGLETSSEGDRN
jgi:hypothetical protein